jgi:hypothetical protein
VISLVTLVTTTEIVTVTEFKITKTTALMFRMLIKLTPMKMVLEMLAMM